MCFHVFFSRRFGSGRPRTATELIPGTSDLALPGVRKNAPGRTRKTTQNHQKPSEIAFTLAFWRDLAEISRSLSRSGATGQSRSRSLPRSGAIGTWKSRSLPRSGATFRINCAHSRVLARFRRARATPGRSRRNSDDSQFGASSDVIVRLPKRPGTSPARIRPGAAPGRPGPNLRENNGS